MELRPADVAAEAARQRDVADARRAEAVAVAIKADKLVYLTDSTGVTDNTTAALAVYPNPANDRLNVVLPAGTSLARARVIDLAGKTVLATNLGTNGLDISGLSSGSYVLDVELATGTVQARFAKQ